MLLGMAAAGSAALLPKAAAQQVPNAHAIDVHNHFGSPAYIEALRKKEGKHVAGYTTWFALQNWKTGRLPRPSRIWISRARKPA